MKMKNLKFITMLCVLICTIGFQQAVPATDTPQEAKNMASSKRIIEEGYNKGNTAVADEIVASNYKVFYNGVVDEKTGPDAIKDNIKMNRERFQGFKVIIDDIFAKGNKVTLCWTIEFISKVSGKPAKSIGVYIGKFDKGKLVEGWQTFDTWAINKEFGFTLTPPAPPGKK
jgi:hypothetical protein